MNNNQKETFGIMREVIHGDDHGNWIIYPCMKDEDFDFVQKYCRHYFLHGVSKQEAVATCIEIERDNYFIPGHTDDYCAIDGDYHDLFPAGCRNNMNNRHLA